MSILYNDEVKCNTKMKRQKYFLSDLLDEKLNVDWDLFDKIQNDFFSGKVRYDLKTRPEKHNGENTTWEHTQNVVKSATSIRLPVGIQRKNLILAALLHDVGKPYRRDNHAADGAKIIEKIFQKEKNFNLIKLAVKHHMISIEMELKDYKKIMLDAKKNNLNLWEFASFLLALNKVDILRGRKFSDLDDYYNEPLSKVLKKEYKLKSSIFESAIKEIE